MKFRTRYSRQRRGCCIEQPLRFEIRLFRTQQFLPAGEVRRNHSDPMVALYHRFFAAGSTLNEPAVVVRGPEPPPPLPRPGSRVRQTIDWRVCGDQDVQPPEVRAWLTKPREA